MKLSNYENEEALDLLADIIDPCANILADENIVTLFRSGAPKIKIVKEALKNHQKEIIEVLARLDNVPVKQYKGNIITMTKSLIELLDDEGLTDFFTLQEQTEVKKFSTLATETTKVIEN